MATDTMISWTSNLVSCLHNRSYVALFFIFFTRSSFRRRISPNPWCVLFFYERECISLDQCGFDSQISSEYIMIKIVQNVYLAPQKIVEKNRNIFASFLN